MEQTSTTPAWWAEHDLPHWETQEQQAHAKRRAAKDLIGFLLNVPYDNADALRIKSWLKPEDFPGVYGYIAEQVWDGYDGQIEPLVLRCIADGYGERIRNGALLTDAYWETSLASIEWAGFILTRIRRQEKELAQINAALARVTGSL